MEEIIESLNVIEAMLSVIIGILVGHVIYHVTFILLEAWDRLR